MLTLTNSFYRFLWFTCENICAKRGHVKKFSQLSTGKDSCKHSLKSSPLLTPSLSTEYQLRPFASNRKKSRIKQILKKINDPKNTRVMSESLQPTLNHVSYGGQFQISSTENVESSTNEWRNSDESTSGQPSQPCEIPAHFRVWETVGRKSDKSNGSTIKLKVVSYNVLAQFLLECHPYLYRKCHPFNLKWDVRAERIYDEIVKLDPDILCLQEVQASHLSTFYNKFEKIGYYGVFKRKTGDRHDGCAVYFKKSLFVMHDFITVEYYQPKLPILNRDNIGMMVKLAPKACDSFPFVVATTHLLYNPKRTDVRLAQIQLLLAEIDRFAYYSNDRECGHLPVILTGDFNSKHDSAVIKLLDHGCVNVEQFRDASDWRRIGVTDICQHLAMYMNRLNSGYQSYTNSLKIYHSSDNAKPQSEDETDYENGNCDFDPLFNTGIVRHGLNLVSVYDKFKPDGQCEATTFQDYWITVDYIYFSQYSYLNLVERLRLPTESECKVLGCIPNDVYGSDHLVLGGVFEITPSKCS